MAASNPLLDIEFLKKLYSHHHREIFARVTALTFDERPIECIEGRITGGSVNVDGTSSMRRSCSLTMVAQNVNISDYYWGLNNKFKLEVGLTLPEMIKNARYWDDDVNTYIYPYKNYPDIIWFPMGLYLFTNFSVSYTTNNYSISLQGKDKMCLLNGQVNGSFFASITFDNEEYYDVANGNRTITKLPIKYIIKEAVHEYAGEPFGNIIVNDLDDLGLELLKYVGAAPMYLFIDSVTGEVFNTKMAPDADGKIEVCTKDGEIFTVDQLSEDADAPYNLDTRTQRQGYTNDAYEPTILYSVDRNVATGDATIGEQPFTIAKISYGQTCGYRTTDIIYAGDLVGNIGESLTSILDKIVTMLGEFEYFYDLDGHFIFQKKMNFIDHKFNPIVSSEAGSDDLYMEENTYVENQAYTSARTWVFDNNELITAFNNTPDILNIKNDFSLWGERKSVSGASLPIHMRYAIGKKPSYYKTYEGKIFVTQEEYDIIPHDTDKIKFTKTTPPTGLSARDWWDILEWARYYAYCSVLNEGKDPLSMSEEELSNYYPQKALFNYGSSSIEYLTMSEILSKLGNGYARGNFSLDTLCQIVILRERNGIKYVDTHMTSNMDYGCAHPYTAFLPGEEYGVGGSGGYYAAYIYQPTIPEADGISAAVEESIAINENDCIICDWREIIYQMAKDYRKHNHEDDFYVQVRKNNGKDISGEWRYPDGITTYEPFYIDLEGFWRQLYCPKFNTNGIQDVVIKDSNLYWANSSVVNDEGDTINLSPTDEIILGTIVSIEEHGEYIISYNDKEYLVFGTLGAYSPDDKVWILIPMGNYNNQKTIIKLAAHEQENIVNPIKGEQVTLDDLPRTAIVHAVRKMVFDPNLYAGHTNDDATKDKYYRTESIDKYLIINDKYDTDKQTLILTFSETTSYGDYSETGWNQAVTSSPETLNFWFDMMDNDSDLANRYGIQTIGDRAKSVNDNSIKAIYFREVPTVIFTENIQTQERKSGYVYMQTGTEHENLFVISTQGKCAQDVLDEYLFKHSYCTEAISMTAVPVYHLEPNTRIYIHDDNSQIDGEYIVSRITLPLTYNGTMTISAIKAVERIY